MIMQMIRKHTACILDVKTRLHHFTSDVLLGLIQMLKDGWYSMHQLPLF